MNKADYTVIVIGGGTAGSNAARTAARNGAQRVALIRNPAMPNTCIRRGCMPSKAVLTMAARGLPFADAMAHKVRIIREFETDLNQSLEEEDFDVIWGNAEFLDEDSVKVTGENGDKTLSAENFVIATGACGFIPPIDGLRDLEPPRAFTSDNVVGLTSALEAVPEKLLVLGAGPIGLEMATFFSRMGTEVRVIEMRDRLLPQMDPEFGDCRLSASRQRGEFPIHPGTKLTKVEQRADGKVRCVVETAAGESAEHSVDAILVATGRKPNLDGLNLENAGLSLEKGWLDHDEQTLVTSNERVYIAGDATGHHQILHIAAKMGQTAGHNAAIGKPEKRLDYSALNMAVIFEEHESAVVGLTEQAARDAGYEVITATRDLSDVGRGITDGVRHGLMKLVVDRETGQVLGGQMLGPHAGEVIHALSAIVQTGATTGQMVDMVWYHPTFSELWHSLANDICQTDSTVCPGA